MKKEGTTKNNKQAHSSMFNPYTALKPAGVGKKAVIKDIPRLFILRNTTKFPPMTALKINKKNPISANIDSPQ
jgi:hypothetical protein